eukprot:COSAG05_NODE_993_length_6264_cov_294.754096_3_plen_73_part_00
MNSEEGYGFIDSLAGGTIDWSAPYILDSLPRKRRKLGEGSVGWRRAIRRSGGLALDCAVRKAHARGFSVRLE